MCQVYVGGSRELQSGPGSAAWWLGSALGSLGVVRRLVVGCAVGADAGFLCGWGSVRGVSGASVFAAFGPGGAGSLPVSAVPVVSRFAAAGGSVSWWAGGGPSVPARVRLARRSSVAVASVPLGSWSFLLLGSPGSVGALRSAVLAARRGLPVFVAPVGFPGSSLPSVFRGVPLSWSPAVLPLGLDEVDPFVSWFSLVVPLFD